MPPAPTSPSRYAGPSLSGPAGRERAGVRRDGVRRPMPLRRMLVALAAAIAGSGAATAAESAPAMTYVTGVINVEDMVRVPGTRWIVASGLAGGQRTDGHIYLVSGEDHAVRILLPGRVDYRPDAKAYPDCPGKPDAARFSAHGLSIRHAPGHRDTLYVVHHGERE